MLKQRIITGLILFALALVIIIWSPTIVFTSIISIIIALAAWEWGGLASWSSQIARVFYAVVLGALVFFTHFLPAQWILGLGVLWWLFAGLLVCRYPKSSHWCTRAWYWRVLMGVAVLIPFAVGLQTLRAGPDDFGRLLLPLCIVWAADTGAFFSGRKFGRHKLAPIVSPNKTIEGAIGGLLFALVIVMVAASFWSVVRSAFWPIFGLAIVTVIFATIGDLFESLLKRQINIKDSSQLIPGHGGILDRMDSMSAAIPVFAFGMLLLHA